MSIEPKILRGDRDESGKLIIPSSAPILYDIGPLRIGTVVFPSDPEQVIFRTVVNQIPIASLRGEASGKKRATSSISMGILYTCTTREEYNRILVPLIAQMRACPILPVTFDELKWQIPKYKTELGFSTLAQRNDLVNKMKDLQSEMIVKERQLQVDWEAYSLQVYGEVTQDKTINNQRLQEFQEAYISTGPNGNVRLKQGSDPIRNELAIKLAQSFINIEQRVNLLITYASLYSQMGAEAEELNDTYLFVVESISASTVVGHPESIQLNISLVYYEHGRFTNMFEFQDENIIESEDGFELDKTRPYINLGPTRLNESNIFHYAWSKLVGDDLPTRDNQIDWEAVLLMSRNGEGFIQKLQPEKDSEIVTLFHNVLPDQYSTAPTKILETRRQITIGKGVGSDGTTQEDVIEQITVSLSTIIKPISLSGDQYPFYQILGFSDAEITIQYSAKSRNKMKLVADFFYSVAQDEKNSPNKSNIHVLGITNDIINSFGIYFVAERAIAANTVVGTTDNLSFVIPLTNALPKPPISGRTRVLNYQIKKALLSYLTKRGKDDPLVQMALSIDPKFFEFAIIGDASPQNNLIGYITNDRSVERFVRDVFRGQNIYIRRYARKTEDKLEGNSSIFDNPLAPIMEGFADQVTRDFAPGIDYPVSTSQYVSSLFLSYLTELYLTSSINDINDNNREEFYQNHSIRHEIREFLNKITSKEEMYKVNYTAIESSDLEISQDLGLDVNQYVIIPKAPEVRNNTPYDLAKQHFSRRFPNIPQEEREELINDAVNMLQAVAVFNSYENGSGIYAVDNVIREILFNTNVESLLDNSDEGKYIKDRIPKVGKILDLNGEIIPLNLTPDILLPKYITNETPDPTIFFVTEEVTVDDETLDLRKNIISRHVNAIIQASENGFNAVQEINREEGILDSPDVFPESHFEATNARGGDVTSVLVENLYLYKDIDPADIEKVKNITSNPMAGTHTYLRANPSARKRLIKEALSSMLNDELSNSLLKSFPTFLITVIEDDPDELSKDDFYFTQSVAEMHIIREYQSPIDVAYIQFNNQNRQITSSTMLNTMESILSSGESFSPLVNDTEFEQPIDGIRFPLMAGAHMHIDLGYGNDITKLERVFNGYVRDLNGDAVIEVVAETYGVEYTHPNETVFTEDQHNSAFRASAKTIATMLVGNPFATSFGTESSEYARKTFEYRRDLRRDPNNAYESIDSAIYGNDYLHLKDSSRYRNIFLPDDDEFRVGFDMTGLTVWEALEQLCLQFPGYCIKVLPYDNRSTLYFGPEDGLYYYTEDPELMKEAQRRRFLINEKAFPEQSTDFRLELTKSGMDILLAYYNSYINRGGNLSNFRYHRLVMPDFNPNVRIDRDAAYEIRQALENLGYNGAYIKGEQLSSSLIQDSHSEDVYYFVYADVISSTLITNTEQLGLPSSRVRLIKFSSATEPSGVIPEFVEITPDTQNQNGIRLGVQNYRVMDGDTVFVETSPNSNSPLFIEGELEGGESFRFRLIGINTEESLSNRAPSFNPSVLNPIGIKAKQYVKTLMDSATNIQIEFEPAAAGGDVFNRELGYVIADGKIVNIEVIRNGWSRYNQRTKSTYYHNYFTTAELAARHEEIGMWNYKYFDPGDTKVPQYEPLQPGLPELVEAPPLDEYGAYAFLVTDPTSFLTNETNGVFESSGIMDSLKNFAASPEFQKLSILPDELKDPTMKPIRGTHSFSSSSNIINCTIYGNTNFYNRVSVQGAAFGATKSLMGIVSSYIGANKGKTKPFSVRPVGAGTQLLGAPTGSSTQFSDQFSGSPITVQAHPRIHPRLAKTLATQNRNCVYDYVTLMVAISLLKNHTEMMYDGEIISVGAARVKPDDIIHITDLPTQTNGPIKARTVIHHFSVYDGFVTTIKPAACVYPNDKISGDIEVVLDSYKTYVSLRSKSFVHSGLARLVSTIDASAAFNPIHASFKQLVSGFYSMEPLRYRENMLVRAEGNDIIKSPIAILPLMRDNIELLPGLDGWRFTEEDLRKKTAGEIWYQDVKSTWAKKFLGLIGVNTDLSGDSFIGYGEAASARAAQWEREVLGRLEQEGIINGRTGRQIWNYTLGGYAAGSAKILYATYSLGFD